MSNTRLFVSNLPDKVNENAIRKAFSNFGEVRNLELKSKTAHEDDHSSQKIFAFITLSASNSQIQSCIQHFTSQDFLDKRLYVTRARESFLERLQRERLEASDEKVVTTKSNGIPKSDMENVHNKKRKLDQDNNNSPNNISFTKKKKAHHSFSESSNEDPTQINKVKDLNHIVMNGLAEDNTDKKQDSEKKRLESMKLKRREFKQKQNIIKTGLVEIDKIPKNKKIIFSENSEVSAKNTSNSIEYDNKKPQPKSLFEDDDEEGDDNALEINFEMKEKLGPKVLELQSRYKSDKRFVLDDRFVEDNENEQSDTNEVVEISQIDEKAKQLNILQEVLGVTINSRPSLAQSEESKNNKKRPKIGMLRYDPTHPDHAKFLLPVVENNKTSSRKDDKKTKNKKEQIEVNNAELPKEQEQPVQRVEVSKEQFYEISDTLKEAIKQPNSFSLRSMFARDEDDKDDGDEEASYIPLESKKGPKIKNPLDPGDVNPFKYDSSESETEEEIKEELPQPTGSTNVWKENLFFANDDIRFKEGLAFFSKQSDIIKKERRNLKSIMKKRLYNKDRKNQMFQKKIGGRKKSFKKSTRRKN